MSGLVFVRVECDYVGHILKPESHLVTQLKAAASVLCSWVPREV